MADRERMMRDLIWSALNRVVALVIVLVLLPVFVVVALSVRKSSPGPVIFRQRRIGYCGRPFHVYKFRTMYVGADSDLVAVMQEQGVSASAFMKLPNDPRVTRVGSFLRRTSLDELPQLWNVVTGDMHLVGPRPLTPELFALCGPLEWRRALVRPGITGLWQLSGRSDLDSEVALQLDTEYVRQRSVLMDARLLVRTLAVPFSRKGAY